jgi:hypothetical protein
MLYYRHAYAIFILTRLVTVARRLKGNNPGLNGLKASGVSSSTMSGGSRFQSLKFLGEKDIFLVSIRQDSS